jgi:ribosome-binding factor A
MAQGSRPDRVAEEVRHVLSESLAREVHDPGIGFVTITHVKVSPDLQLARVNYTCLGDEKAKASTKAALERAKPFLRRQIGAHIRLRRVPELIFHFDEGIAHQARVEELIIEIQKERELHPYQESTPAETTGTAAPTDAAKADAPKKDAE